MKNPYRKREQSEFERIGTQGVLGGALGALAPGGGLVDYLARKGVSAPALHGVHAGRSAVQHMASQGIGDALLGQPEEHGFMDEAKRGALGGAITGGVTGLAETGMMNHGMALVKFLMSKGMGQKAATALALGGGGLASAGIGALGQGLDSGLMNWRSEEA